MCEVSAKHPWVPTDGERGWRTSPASCGEGRLRPCSQSEFWLIGHWGNLQSGLCRLPDNGWLGHGCHSAGQERHSCRDRGDFCTVCKLPGHKDIQTTQIYAEVIMPTRIEAVNRLSDFFGQGWQEQQKGKEIWGASIVVTLFVWKRFSATAPTSRWRYHKACFSMQFVWYMHNLVSFYQMLLKFSQNNAEMTGDWNIFLYLCWQCRLTVSQGILCNG